MWLSGGHRYGEAKTTLDRCLAISSNKFGETHPNTANVVYELGCFFFVKPEDLAGGDDGDAEWSTDLAEDHYNRALTMFIDAYGDIHPSVARVYLRLGTLYIERGGPSAWLWLGEKGGGVCVLFG